MQTWMSDLPIMPHRSYDLQSDSFLQGKLRQTLNIFGYVRILFQLTENRTESYNLAKISYYCQG